MLRTLSKPRVKAAVNLNGPMAESLGRIDSTNPMLWVLAADAKVALAWRGLEDGGVDFTRAMTVDEGSIGLGDDRGVICQVGDCGWSYLWRLDDGVALVCHRRSALVPTMKESQLQRALGLRVAQFPVGPDVETIGGLAIESGALALVVPYALGDFTDDELTQAKKKALSLDDRALVPLANGLYDVRSHRFAPSNAYEDELGSFGACIRITLSQGGRQ